MRKIIDRTGETNTNNQGLKMTLIEYRGAMGIDVEFEDGTIVRNKQYKDFKNGKIKNPTYRDSNVKDRTGDINTNNQGLKMKVIAYRSYADIDIQFEDGVIVRNKDYGNFKNGRIKNPTYIDSNAKDRTGEINTNTQGLKMRIIAYRTSMDIDVQFEDGTIVRNKAYSSFKTGHIKHPEYKVQRVIKGKTGETNINNQGLKMKIIAYRRYADIDVQFEDGVIVRNKQYDSFKNGRIKNPTYRDSSVKDRTGETATNNQGLKMTIIAYRGSRDIDIKFEDGTVVRNKAYQHFKSGYIKYPKHV